jgi:hypothetical protein
MSKANPLLLYREFKRLRTAASTETPADSGGIINGAGGAGFGAPSPQDCVVLEL